MKPAEINTNDVNTNNGTFNDIGNYLFIFIAGFVVCGVFTPATLLVFYNVSHGKVLNETLVLGKIINSYCIRYFFPNFGSNPTLPILDNNPIPEPTLAPNLIPAPTPTTSFYDYIIYLH